MTIYRSAIISRRADLTEAQFRDHWIQIHGDLASKMPGIGTYRQNHIVERFHEALEAPVQAIDGISQLSFESIEAMEVSDASAEYAEVKKDIPNFQGGITILVLKSQEVVKAASPVPKSAAKLLWVSTRRAMPAEEAMHPKWLLEVGPEAAAVPGVLRCVQNFVIDRAHPVHAGVPAGDAGPVEAITEMWFDNADALRVAVHSAQGRRFIFHDPFLSAMAVYRIEEIHII